MTREGRTSMKWTQAADHALLRALKAQRRSRRTFRWEPVAVAVASETGRRGITRLQCRNRFSVLMRLHRTRAEATRTPMGGALEDVDRIELLLAELGAPATRRAAHDDDDDVSEEEPDDEAELDEDHDMYDALGEDAGGGGSSARGRGRDAEAHPPMSRGQVDDGDLPRNCRDWSGWLRSANYVLGKVKDGNTGWISRKAFVCADANVSVKLKPDAFFYPFVRALRVYAKYQDARRRNDDLSEFWFLDPERSNLDDSRASRKLIRRAKKFKRLAAVVYDKFKKRDEANCRHKSYKPGIEERREHNWSEQIAFVRSFLRQPREWEAIAQDVRDETNGWSRMTARTCELLYEDMINEVFDYTEAQVTDMNDCWYWDHHYERDRLRFRMFEMLDLEPKLVKPKPRVKSRLQQALDSMESDVSSDSDEDMESEDEEEPDNFSFEPETSPDGNDGDPGESTDRVIADDITREQTDDFEMVQESGDEAEDGDENVTPATKSPRPMDSTSSATLEESVHRLSIADRTVNNAALATTVEILRQEHAVTADTLSEHHTHLAELRTRVVEQADSLEQLRQNVEAALAQPMQEPATVAALASLRQEVTTLIDQIGGGVQKSVGALEAQVAAIMDGNVTRAVFQELQQAQDALDGQVQIHNERIEAFQRDYITRAAFEAKNQALLRVIDGVQLGTRKLTSSCENSFAKVGEGLATLMTHTDSIVTDTKRLDQAQSVTTEKIRRLREETTASMNDVVSQFRALGEEQRDFQRTVTSNFLEHKAELDVHTEKIEVAQTERRELREENENLRRELAAFKAQREQDALEMVALREDFRNMKANTLPPEILQDVSDRYVRRRQRCQDQSDQDTLYRFQRSNPPNQTADDFI